MKAQVVLGVFVGGLAMGGCAKLGALKGKTGARGDAGKTGTDAGGDLSDGVSKGSADAAATRSKIETELAAMLGSEARFSVASLQGKPLGLCQATNERTPLAVWQIEGNGDISCFAFNRDDLDAYEFRAFEDLGDYQRKGTIYEPFVVGKPDIDDVIFMKSADAVWVIATGAKSAKSAGGGKGGGKGGTSASRLVAGKFALKAEGKSVDRNLILMFPEHFLAQDHLDLDVLVGSSGDAKSLDLAAEKQAFAAKASKAMKAFATEQGKRDAAEVAKVKFPATVKVDGDAKLVAAAKRYLEAEASGAGGGINPTLIKKVAVTSKWTVNKSSIGLVLSRVADVTVGFARDASDPYSMDPNKKCAIATFVVQQDYVDGGYQPEVRATGAASKWTNIRCDRL